MLLLRFLERVPPLDSLPWIAHPLAMHIGFAALSLLSTGAVAAWFGRRAGFWGFWFGGTMLTALLAVAIATIMPGAAYVTLIAALAAALGSAPCCIIAIMQGRAPSQAAADFAVLLPGLIALAVLLPLLLLLYSALGAPAWPIGTVSLCLAAVFLLPLLCKRRRPPASASPQWRR